MLTTMPTRAEDAPPVRAAPTPDGEAEAPRLAPGSNACLPGEFAPDADIWQLDRATVELPVGLRIQNLRTVMFLGAIVLTDDDERRQSGLTEMRGAYASYTLLASALSDPATVLADFPSCAALVTAVRDAHAADIESLEQHGTLIAQTMDAIEAGDTNVGAYNLLYDNTNLRIAPCLCRLHDALSQEVILKQSSLQKAAKSARSDALDACAEISQIAKTVQLISLNARVEAARAGESGRAFGVIAGEIKDLSEKAGVTSKRVSAAVETIMQQISA